MLKSEHGSWLNWTPKNGPEGVSATPGLKCCWIIWLAVRVENAFPCDDDRYAPVSALEIASKVVGTATPSSPFSGGGGIEVVATPVLEVTVAIAGAPIICVTANTLPTRSTTAIVAGAPSA